MIIALITARGGSKGLPGKNIRPMLDRPLIAWTIKAALDSQSIDHVYVSSDDEQILSVSEKWGADTIRRPSHLAQDSSSSDDVVAHAIGNLNSRGVQASVIVLLQPTSPLRTNLHIDGCLGILSETKSDCVISVYEPKHTPIKAYITDDTGRLRGLYSENAPYEPRQSLPKAYQPNGAVYAFRKAAFLKQNKIPRTNVYPFLMLESESVDIDDLSDFEHAENLLRLKNES